MTPSSAPRLSTREPARKTHPIARAKRLSHVTFERPDLDRTAAFLEDFGLEVVRRTNTELLLRGSHDHDSCYVVRRGPRPRFLGLGFEVGSLLEIQTLAALPGATRIASVGRLENGVATRLRDPSGFEVEALLATERKAPEPVEIPADGRTSRPNVLRLGQVVIEVADFQASSAWYTEHFGLIPSDVEVLPDGSPARAYFRLDQGATPTPSHALGIAQGFVPSLNRSAFVVRDADAIRARGVALTKRGWTHAWGMGRRIVGAHVCECWKDAYGDKHEHYCGGELVDATREPNVHPMAAESVAPWTKVPSSRISNARWSTRSWLRAWAWLRGNPKEYRHVFS
ncbi:MAG: VOC family protein [Myxococcota bacterium]